MTVAVFDNAGDAADGLRTILSQSFHDVDVETIPSATMFTAGQPLPPRA